MKNLLIAALIAAPAAGFAAEDDIMMQPASQSVEATVGALVSAIEGAGATVFAVVDHGAGAMAVGSDIGESQLVIFGNPALGTPAMADNRLAGLFLPLKMLVFEDAQGQVQIAYEDPEERLDELDGIDDDAAYLGKMRTALGTFASTAAN
jgi:uncharacterized protein (DUF302 family)